MVQEFSEKAKDKAERLTRDEQLAESYCFWQSAMVIGE